MMCRPHGKRLLLLNPNTSRSVTERIAGAAAAVASPGIEFVPRMWQADTLLALAPRKPHVGTFWLPDPKPTSGLSPALAAWIEHRD